MKKIYLFAKVALFFVLLNFSGCNPKQEVKPSPHTDQVAISDIKTGIIDPNMEIVAQSLAKSLGETSMREFIKTEASKHFDAAPDLLYSQIQKRVVDKVDFTHTLANNMSTPGARVDAVNQLEEISSKIPLLNISVPVNLESWDAKNYTPLVAVRPSYSSKDFTHYKAFDRDGKVHWLDANVEPTVPVIVVGLNERVSIDNKGTVLVRYYNSEAATKSACPGCRIDPDAVGTNAYQEDPEGGGGGGTPPKQTTPPTTGCDRDKKSTREELGSFKFASVQAMRNAESWGDGILEMRCVVTLGGTTAAAFQNLNKYRSVNRPCTKTCDVLGLNCWAVWCNQMEGIEIVTWYSSEYGNKMKYTWIEEDPEGDSQETSVSLTTTFKTADGSTIPVTGSTKIITKKYDWPMGDSFVEYCEKADGEGTQYNAGEIYFYVRHRAQ